MSFASTFIVSFFTAIATAVGTVYLVERLDVFGSEPETVMVSVPNLGGLSEEDAAKNLAALGLKLLVGGREKSAKAKPGTVIRQTLPAGGQAKEGTPVSITLAEAMTLMPSVEGKTLEEARQVLTAAKVSFRIGDPIADEQVPMGSVVRQSPAAGQALADGQEVTIHASSGPGAVEVPKLRGLILSGAKKRIQDAGLKVGKLRWVARAETRSYLVLSQTPKAGDKAPKGSEVQLIVNN